jgi:hypothetical protein
VDAGLYNIFPFKSVEIRTRPVLRFQNGRRFVFFHQNLGNEFLHVLQGRKFRDHAGTNVLNAASVDARSRFRSFTQSDQEHAIGR